MVPPKEIVRESLNCKVLSEYDGARKQLSVNPENAHIRWLGR